LNISAKCHQNRSL